MNKVLIILLILFKQESNPETFIESDSFAIKLTVALISSLMSFFIAYFFYRRNKSKEPYKQISYDIEYSNGLVEIDEKIRENIEVLYRNQSVKKLSYIKATFENTGNKLIKKQQIRFSLNGKSTFFETYFNPIPEKELHTEEITDSHQEENEKTIIIGHFEKNQKVCYHIITSGENPKISIHPYNDEGGVEFITRKSSKETDDKEILTRFFVIIFVVVIVPEIFDFFELMNFKLSHLVRLLIVVVLSKDIFNGIKILVDKIFETRNIVNAYNAKIVGTSNVLFQHTNIQEEVDIKYDNIDKNTSK